MAFGGGFLPAFLRTALFNGQSRNRSRHHCLSGYASLGQSWGPLPFNQTQAAWASLQLTVHKCSENVTCHTKHQIKPWPQIRKASTWWETGHVLHRKTVPWSLNPAIQNFLKCQQVYELSQPSSPPQSQTTMKALNSQKQNLSQGLNSCKCNQKICKKKTTTSCKSKQTIYDFPLNFCLSWTHVKSSARQSCINYNLFFLPICK